MTLYTESLFWTVGACAATRLALVRQSRQQQRQQQKSEAAVAATGAAVASSDGVKDRNDESRRQEFKAFQRSFLVVALLAMFSDWTMGPYSYALYAYYGYDQGDIAMLYVGGYLSSMLAGSFVGSLADKYGRKKMAVMYAVLYMVSCFIKLVNNYYVLMFGRFFAGVATSLLFSAFEAWMVCEHNKRGFDPAWLSQTFGYLTLGNGFVAVLAGLVANFFATRYGYIAPYMFCLLPLSLVGLLAGLWWPENYGDTSLRPFQALPKAWAFIRSHPAILYLGLGQSCFEGAMYAFVFIWTPALEMGGEDVGPFLGIIFSAFMVCTMTGSNIFSILIGRGLLSTVPVIVHVVATLVNLGAYKFVHQTTSVYLAFLLFELTVGMFYPSYGSIKSQHIPEEVRSGVMNIFRVPLNAIMVVLLGLIEVKKMSMRTSLALCTLIHGVALIMYLRFDRLNNKQGGGGVAAVPYAALVMESGSNKKMPDAGNSKKDKVAPFA